VRQLNAAKVFRRPIVTTVTALEVFHPAEADHQDFLARNPNHPYIVYHDVPKLRHLEQAFPELLKSR
jgi:peptide-methionine (S)-S-oxide reductase